MQDHVINKPCVLLRSSHMNITIVVEKLNMILFSVAPFLLIYLYGSHRGRIFKSIPRVMHLKVTYTELYPSIPHLPALLLPDKLRCRNPLSDIIFPLELWPTEAQAGGARECPEIAETD